MSSTGYTAERAAPSTRAEDAVYDTLAKRGYNPMRQPLDGHMPDLRLSTGEYVEVKTSERNLAIELNDFVTWRCLRAIVYIVHVHPEGWTVDTPESLTSRISLPKRLGPQRSSGTGSLDDWLLISRGGTPFDEYFPDETIRIGHQPGAGASEGQ
jgi:hypothetical protein